MLHGHPRPAKRHCQGSFPKPAEDCIILRSEEAPLAMLYCNMQLYMPGMDCNSRIHLDSTWTNLQPHGSDDSTWQASDDVPAM